MPVLGRVVLLAALTGCDGFPIVGPLLGTGKPEEPYGTIAVRVIIPCHDSEGRTFPCPVTDSAATDTLPRQRY